MRVLCRAHNLPFILGIASNLYQFQLIFYSRIAELRCVKLAVTPQHSLELGDMQMIQNFYKFSSPWTLYDKNAQYSYSDLYMKETMSYIAGALKWAMEHYEG
jgi:hypothetical protein